MQAGLSLTVLHVMFMSDAVVTTTAIVPSAKHTFNGSDRSPGRVELYEFTFDVQGVRGGGRWFEFEFDVREAGEGREWFESEFGVRQISREGGRVGLSSSSKSISLDFKIGSNVFRGRGEGSASNSP